MTDLHKQAVEAEKWLNGQGHYQNLSYIDDEYGWLVEIRDINKFGYSLIRLTDAELIAEAMRLGWTGEFGS